MSRFYDEVYKWYLYAQYQGGRTLTQLCDETGITDKPLREWFRRFDKQCEQARSITLEDIRQQNAELHSRIRQKRVELDFLRNMRIVETIPEILRISCAYPLLERFGPNQVCRALKIRKSNLYYQTFRKPAVTEFERHNQELRPAIRKICTASPKRVGAETIRRQLMEQGFTVSKHKVLELFHELPSQWHRRTEKDNSNDDWQIGPVNILSRRFKPPRPNMAWASDITDIKTDSGVYHLCVVLDLFAKRVIAARLSSKKDALLTRHTFQDAFDQRGSPVNLLFHSDQGTQYTATDFRRMLHKCHVAQSFSTPGVPYDNAPMESFFARLKTEETHRYRYRGVPDLTASLQEYISFYNFKRPHSSAKNLPPAEAERLYWEQQNAASKSADCVLLSRQKKMCGRLLKLESKL